MKRSIIALSVAVVVMSACNASDNDPIQASTENVTERSAVRASLRRCFDDKKACLGVQIYEGGTFTVYTSPADIEELEQRWKRNPQRVLRRVSRVVLPGH